MMNTNYEMSEEMMAQVNAEITTKEALDFLSVVVNMGEFLHSPSPYGDYLTIWIETPSGENNNWEDCVMPVCQALNAVTLALKDTGFKGRVRIGNPTEGGWPYDLAHTRWYYEYQLVEGKVHKTKEWSCGLCFYGSDRDVM